MSTLYEVVFTGAAGDNAETIAPSTGSGPMSPFGTDRLKTNGTTLYASVAGGYIGYVVPGTYPHDRVLTAVMRTQSRVDSNNFYINVFGGAGGVDFIAVAWCCADESVVVFRYFGGSVTVLASYSTGSLALDTDHMFVCTVSGSTLSVSVNGTTPSALAGVDISAFAANTSRPGIVVNNAVTAGVTSFKSFKVEGVAAAALAFTTQPSDTASGLVMSPAVVVEARTAGSVDTGFTGAITMALLGSGGFEAGTKIVNAVIGASTFNALRPCVPGTYRYRATATDYTTVDSDEFTVTGGSGGTIILGAPMRSPDIRKNEPDAEKRRIFHYVQNTDGSPHTSNITDKALLSLGGDLESGEPTESPADPVHIFGGLHYVQLAQPYVDIDSGTPIISLIPSASGRRESPSDTMVIPGDIYAAAASEDGITAKVVRASNGLDGFGFEVDEVAQVLRVKIPGSAVVEVPIVVDANRTPIKKVGTVT